MAKKPDIRYKEEKDVEKLAPLGLEILKRSADYVKAGGVLIYSTCTLRRDENEDTVEAFLASDPSFSLCPFRITSRDESMPDVDCDGLLTVMPHVHGTDGFFIAKLKKSL
jgi:16S rRNA (cytosine967-C5)-methyltransferase